MSVSNGVQGTREARDPDDAAWLSHYSAQPVVGSYRGDDRLQAPEQAILALLGSAVRQASLLDVGVGGGRTALHLGGVCKSYLGVDYSAAMVRACHERFASAPWYTAERFQQADARALPFEHERFDIVLFSYNGLDYMPAPERATALAEFRRVLKPGGWFIYSGHNLGWFDGPGWLPRSRGWADWLDQYRYRAVMKRLNRNLAPTHALDAADLLEPPDGLRVHHARPTEHLRELQAAGLSDTRVFDGQGREITGAPGLNASRDAWVYYLARRRSAAAA